MRTLLIGLGALLPMLPLWADTENTAQARLYCLSLRFHRGTEPFDFYSLDLTTVAAGHNGELAPDFSASPFTHYSYLTLNDKVWFMEYPGSLSLDVPMDTDTNDDGFPDFFEAAQSANATSSGQYSFPGYASGVVQATWTRGAGLRFGTCVLNFKMNPFQSLAVFTHTFELLEYTGSLHYTPGSNGVAGSVALVQTDNPVAELKGPVRFSKVTTNRFNELELLPGGWTNEYLQIVTYPTHFMERDVRWPTNYYGFLEFDDGDFYTSDPDYWLWMFSIDDLNDRDHDGIPDFSDDPPAVTPPRRALLSLSKGEANLWLAVHGEVGRTCHVQEATNLASPDWQTVSTVILTNDPQSVSLPTPAANLYFWRVLTE